MYEKGQRIVTFTLYGMESGGHITTKTEKKQPSGSLRTERLSVWGYVDNAYSLVNIQAMCDSVAYCISRAALNQLFSSSIGLANLGLRLMDHQFLQQENWLINSGSPRAKERYLNLIKETPELLQYVPLKHIASYLWITPQSLSRIRAEIVTNNIVMTD